MSKLNEKVIVAKIASTTTEPKPSEKKQETKAEEIKPILETKAEKRIKNFDNFQSLCKKFNFLKMKADELSSYLIGRDGLKETLKIENTDGKIFEISNSRIITKILVLSQDELLTQLENTEKEVIEFVI